MTLMKIKKKITRTVVKDVLKKGREEMRSNVARDVTPAARAEKIIRRASEIGEVIAESFAKKFVASQDKLITEIRPAPKFDFPLAIRVPTEVHESGQARIVGREYGLDRNHGRKMASGRTRLGNCWVYYIAFDDGDTWWLAGEEEIDRWQKETEK
jgi:hypothetical protein